MSDAIKENNKLRTQQIGNMSASEMTKREQMALHILNGILTTDNTFSYEEMVDNSVYIADLLIEKLNSNLWKVM